MARLPQWLGGKESTCNAGASEDTDMILRLGRSPGAGHGKPLQYSCLKNYMDRGAWQVISHGLAKRGTQLKQVTTHVLRWYTKDCI